MVLKNPEFYFDSTNYSKAISKREKKITIKKQ